MADAAIRVEHLSKRYRIGAKQVAYKTLREGLAQVLTRRLFRRQETAHSSEADQEDIIWALKSVSFEIQKGEIIGIIGRNGAGKSTLLKILSRITEPTEGYAEVRGRVRSLLEVGTGFHPELTGRENIYLNGAILGMKKAELDKKFDEIVDFSGVEKFIDTTVKRYSSGMRVRLAFAVAAHLEPEVLLVDEVLAVGDAEFQKKCLGKMSDVAKEGRTVLLVSHNMGAIGRLCQRSILLDHGRMIAQGDSRTIIQDYLGSGIQKAAEIEYPNDPRKRAQIRRVRLTNDLGCSTTELDRTRPFRIEIEVKAWQHVSGACVSFLLQTADGTSVCDSCTLDTLGDFFCLPEGRTYLVKVEFPGDLLMAGHYDVRVAVSNRAEPLDLQWPIRFRLNDSSSFASTRISYTHTGVLLLRLPWEVRVIEGARV